MHTIGFRTAAALGRRQRRARGLGHAAAAFSTGPAAPLPDVVIRGDGAVQAWTGGSKPFLAAHPRGAYTTARTVRGGTAVFELEAHVDRTAESLRLMHADAGTCVALEPSVFRERFVGSMAAAVRGFYAQQGDAAGREARVTVLATVEDAEVHFYSHAGELPPPRRPPVAVEVRGSPRSDAAAKDSSWVTDRQGLEQLKGTDVDEIILRGDDGELLEGSQTNFYAVRDGALWTAEEGVLAGTVRSLVLRVCAEQGVEVVLQPPNLSDLHLWDGCLISSTSRLLLPVDTVCVCREGFAWEASLDDSRTFEPDDLTHMLGRLLAAEVEDNSVELPPV